MKKRTSDGDTLGKNSQAYEARYKALLSGFDGFVYICSDDYRIEFANHNLMDQIGQNPTGRRCHSGLYGLDLRCPWCVHETVLTGETVRNEFRSPVNHRWYSAVNSPIYYRDGSISNHVALFDITDRKSTDQALKDAHYIISKSPAVAFLWKNSAGWPVEFVTDNVEAVFGYSSDDFISGKISYSDVVHPRDLARVADEVSRYSADRSREKFEHQPYRIVTEQGQTRWVEDKTFMRRNESGDITHYQGIVEDITTRKKSEESLRLAQHCIDEASIGIFRIAQDSRILDVNATACKNLGYSREELCAMTVLDIDPEFTPSKWKNHRQELRGKGIKRIESRHRRKDGTVFPVEVLINYHEFEGEAFSNSFVIDISERKKAQAEKEDLQKQLLLAQKMEAVGQMAGGIAHDFNNLLQVIAGNAQLLLANWDQHRQGYTRLKQIESASLNASDLTRRMLTYCRKIESNLRPVSLNTEIELIIAILERSLPKMIVIDLHLDDALYDVNADPLQIEQILMNLAINAKHAMPDGGKLIIETRNMCLDREFSQTHLGAREGEYAALVVSDTGIGMTQDTLDRIYDPFFSTKKTGEGTGLGLSMVYGIVKNHGGYITCTSNPEKGTTFEIYFPATNIAPADCYPGTLPERLRKGNSTETILVVDDDPAVVELIESMLGQNGYCPLTAFSGEEAVIKYKSDAERIDLVILDLNMPGMGGTKCLEELLEFDPAVKVIVASGLSTNTALRDLLEASAGDFIGKPFDMAGLLKKIRNVLDTRDASHAVNT